MRPCRSNTVAGSLNSPNRGFSKYFASLSSSTDVPFSDWGHVFLTRSANRSTSQSVWTDNKLNTITNTTPLKKKKKKLTRIRQSICHSECHTTEFLWSRCFTNTLPNFGIHLLHKRLPVQSN